MIAVMIFAAVPIKAIIVSALVGITSFLYIYYHATRGLSSVYMKFFHFSEKILGLYGRSTIFLCV
jgi:hypothetical protein